MGSSHSRKIKPGSAFRVADQHTLELLLSSAEIDLRLLSAKARDVPAQNLRQRLLLLDTVSTDETLIPSFRRASRTPRFRVYRTTLNIRKMEVSVLKPLIGALIPHQQVWKSIDALYPDHNGNLSPRRLNQQTNPYRFRLNRFPISQNRVDLLCHQSPHLQEYQTQKVLRLAKLLSSGAYS